MSMIDLIAPKTSIRHSQTGFLLDEVGRPVVYRKRGARFITRYQPTLADGRRLYKFGVLPPEWKNPPGSNRLGINEPLQGHKPVLFTTPGRAVDAAVKELLAADRKKQKEMAVQQKWEPQG